MSTLDELKEQHRTLGERIRKQERLETAQNLRRQFERLARLKPDVLHAELDKVLELDYQPDSYKKRVITADQLADTLTKVREPK